MTAEQDIEEIRRLMDIWVETYNSGNMTALKAMYTKYYTDSCIMVLPGVPDLIKGATAIGEAVANVISTGCDKAEMHDQIIEHVSDDVIVTTGCWTLIWSDTNQRRNMTDVLVFKKFPNGQWMVVRDIFNYRT